MDETIKPLVAQTLLGPIQYLVRNDVQIDPPETILAIHGAMGGYEQSDILARSVGPEGFKYLCVSRPGYLKTPLKGNESPANQADLLAALLDELGINRVVILAISGGGYSALHFALRHPDRCKALILCSTIGGKNSVPIPFAFNIIKVAARIPFLDKFMRSRFEKNVEKSLRRSISHKYIANEMISNSRLMDFYKELTLSTLDCISDRLPGTVNDIRVTQNTEYPLEDISVPTLVIHGTDDPVVPFNEHGQKLAERILGARLVLVEKGEHMAIFTHNDLVKNSINDFLNQIEKR